jgi:hypothetical protein
MPNAEHGAVLLLIKSETSNVPQRVKTAEISIVKISTMQQISVSMYLCFLLISSGVSAPIGTTINTFIRNCLISDGQFQEQAPVCCQSVKS